MGTTELDANTVKKFIEQTEHKYFTTHEKLCFAIINRIYIRLLAGYRFGAIKISDDELIIDGNHRYIAYQLAGIEIEIISGTRSFSDNLKNFNEIIIDFDEDWDANNKKTKKFCTDEFLKEHQKVK